MILRELAHSRTGDKGNIVTMSLIAYRAEDYPRLVQHITAERVTALFAGLIVEAVQRYEVPNLQALNFVLKRPLNQSVTRSLAIDAHGKSLGSLMLGLEIE